LVPCQDTPSNKVTYEAKVYTRLIQNDLIFYQELASLQISAPHDLTVLMSAIRQGDPVQVGDRKTHSFHQPVLIPSYL
jgi:aminopeptidase N